MVLPTAKLAASESVPAPPDSSVAPVIGAGGPAWLLTELPVMVADGLKKLSDALSAEAATNEVSARVLIDAVSVDCRFSVVATVSTPIANVPAGGGVVVVAVSSIDSTVP